MGSWTATKTVSRRTGSSLFAKEVRPIFADRCYGCHGPETQQNGLRLDSLVHILKASNYGPVIKAQTLKPMGDGSLLANGTNPQADTYVMEAATHAADITAIRLEVLPDAGLPRGDPGRDPAGNFFLSDFKVEMAPASNPTAFSLAFPSVAVDRQIVPTSAYSLTSKSIQPFHWPPDVSCQSDQT